MPRSRTVVFGLVAAVVVGTALVFPVGAAALPPTVLEHVPVNNPPIVLPGICPFDITFTSTGWVDVTTFFDNNGVPVAESVHGALTHTVFSAWRTLVSNGPAPVHFDLTSGNGVDTGMELGFHIPGDGVVFGVSGRLTFAADGSQLSFVGHSVLDAATPCAALAP